MITDKIKSPIISRNKHDPTNSYRPLNKSYRDIEERYYQIKVELKQLFDLYLTGYERESNSDYLFKQGTLYQVNSGYIYDMSTRQLAELLKKLQEIVDSHLLEGGDNELWAFSFIEEQYRRGTHATFTNFSHQSSYYAQQTTMSALLARPVYQNQVMQAFILGFNDWKTLTEKAKGDLSSVLANAITRGINPRDTARVISKRLDVSLSLAKQLAQTEQLGAYRESSLKEIDWTMDRLGLKTAVLQQSALLPTSRESHVYWHGRIRTTEEVRDWYAENGNRYNCHCTCLPILLDENDEPYNELAIKKLTAERKTWTNEESKQNE